jgi:hypothetical protein
MVLVLAGVIRGSASKFGDALMETGRLRNRPDIIDHKSLLLLPLIATGLKLVR